MHVRRRLKPSDFELKLKVVRANSPQTDQLRQEAMSIRVRIAERVAERARELHHGS